MTKTNSTYNGLPKHKEELQQRNRLGTVSRKTTAGVVGGGEEG